ncbi:hypothetical protein A3F27_00090 [Candidatus Kaiserbacteria bacterium RIFCSPHIGHO2_12_FULL_53_13]|uniref:DUF4386 domain-containing protein n=1 Tax=Candidatus Kaiserbacteria bacterium RIFCSPHIGHO2_12_FULL_53_13 TaxID=1798502 RepID=A0A1F6EC80_9BACT|nr:MAG: hypothetical protein A3F27_00090 [Candidatus Kaiserbacteria bacterium RIFCSPHIGHO2_12_FULL_53_13]OGG74293.1 MAG: hypothetical protein A3A37_03155 [Candidatus Kaiserbacteria bacterium RIFCSPLOWO2_01_FULL_52_36]
MINTNHLLKVTAAWVSIVYVVCFLGVALFPGIRPAFMYYGLHTTTNLGENVMTLTTFVSGLAVWNVVAYLAVGLFAVLFNRIKA